MNRRHVFRALIVPLGFLLGAVVTLVVAPMFVGPPTSTVPTDRQVTPAEQLIDRHDCWTEEAPADMRGEIPGHVVVTTRGDRTRYSSDLVDEALGQIFDGADHGLTVHAFCR